MQVCRKNAHSLFRMGREGRSGRGQDALWPHLRWREKSADPSLLIRDSSESLNWGSPGFVRDPRICDSQGSSTALREFVKSRTREHAFVGNSISRVRKNIRESGAAAARGKGDGRE